MGEDRNVEHLELSSLTSDFELVLFMDFLDLKNVRMALEMAIRALRLDPAFVHDHNMISKMDEVNSMGNQDSSLVVHEADNNLLKDGLAHFLIKGRYRVI